MKQKTLTNKLETKESDIKDLRKILKEKQEQLSEMTIRKELAEKKLGNVNKDYELTIEKLQRKLEEGHNSFKKKEKEFEETLDHLQSDIDSLENEKGEMKEKLKVFCKKNILEGMTKSATGSQLMSLQSSLGPSLPAIIRDSPLLLQEIDNLRTLFNNEREVRLNLQNKNMLDVLNSMKPLPKFKGEPDEVLDSLFKEGAALKQEILMSLAMPKFPSLYNVKCGNGSAAWQKHFIEERDKMLSLKSRAENFQGKVTSEIVKRAVGGQIETDFTTFPTNEMSKVINERETTNIGSIRIPRSYLPSTEKPGIVKLEVDFDNLQKLIGSLVF